jgi:hypothetical protein
VRLLLADGVGPLGFCHQPLETPKQAGTIRQRVADAPEDCFALLEDLARGVETGRTEVDGQLPQRGMDPVEPLDVVPGGRRCVTGTYEFEPAALEAP